MILRILIGHGGETYGLDLVKRSNGAVGRGTVYVLLDRMEDKGLIESREEEAPTDGYVGIPRRLYKPTGAGVRALHMMEIGELIVNGELAR